MGSMDGNCYWCRRWEGLYIPDWVGEGMCSDCLDWMINTADNPAGRPHRPDGIDITTDYIKKIFRTMPTVVFVSGFIAEFLRHWHEPGWKGGGTGPHANQSAEW